MELALLPSPLLVEKGPPLQEPLVPLSALLGLQSPLLRLYVYVYMYASAGMHVGVYVGR